MAQERDKWAGCCDYRNEHLGSINYRLFLDYLGKYKFLEGMCSIELVWLASMSNQENGRQLHKTRYVFKINFSFQLQTSQVFKKELTILVLKYKTVCPEIF